MKRKSILITVNLIALIISIIWAIKSDWEFEPIVASLGLMGTLIALFTNSEQNISQNQKSGNDSSNIQSGGDTIINK